MKNTIITYSTILVIVLFFCYSFTTPNSKNRHFYNKTVNDSIVIDSLRIDSIGNLYKLYKDSVHASYYHDKFNGRKTASGKVFNNSEYTAAHKTLPFGTKVLVTNLVNNQSALVTITDRGPFIKGREIDLTKKVFMEIAQNKKRGILQVKLEILYEQ
ncbi:septal ring lytic transglycosylase RlpA family protein [Flavobacterium sp.]|uniref:septal ring lytic transglycosylase RlpA family protein n=1 Tax=Flavobacterium sp. TaxID=239 RepID=UPI003527876B